MSSEKKIIWSLITVLFVANLFSNGFAIDAEEADGVLVSPVTRAVTDKEGNDGTPTPTDGIAAGTATTSAVGQESDTHDDEVSGTPKAQALPTHTQQFLFLAF